MATSSETNHAPWLDWLRFGAAFVVLLCHTRGFFFVEYGALDSSSRTLLTATLFAMTRIGSEAVILFFVLSGYFVCGAAIKKMLAGTFNVKAYAIDRSTRIYVSYVPALILTWFSAVSVGYPTSVTQLFGNLLGLQGVICGNFADNAPLWTLSYEIWFYMLIGVIGAQYHARSRGTYCFMLGLCVCAIVFSVLQSHYLFCWLIGGAAYFVERRRHRLATIFAALVIIVVSTCVVELQMGSKSVGTRWWFSWLPSKQVSELCLASGLALIIKPLSYSRPTGRLSQAIGNLGTNLASFSFSLYLIHYPVLGLLRHHIDRRSTFHLSDITLYLGLVTSALVFAWSFYQLTEKHTDTVRRMARALVDKDAVEV